jgi:ketosteroid isomerase-like protein
LSLFGRAEPVHDSVEILARRSRYDGTYDKTNLAYELVMSDYFRARDGKIVSLTVIFNQPSPY